MSGVEQAAGPGQNGGGGATSAVLAVPRVSAGAETALARARERLLALQHPDGWWRGELQTNVTMDAEDLLLREFLGVRGAEETRAHGRAWIRSQQRADGTWANFHGGAGRPVDDGRGLLPRCASPATRPRAEHMRRAAAFVLERGRLERARVFTHIWLALFGLWSWDDVPALPPELVLLPPWFPLNVYDFACWARQTIVALSVVDSGTAQRGELRLRPRRAALRRVRPSARARASGPRAARLGLARIARPRSTSAGRSGRCGGWRSARAERWIIAPPGGRRLLGRHPAAVGLLADGAAPRAAIRSITR